MPENQIDEKNPNPIDFPWNIHFGTLYCPVWHRLYGKMFAYLTPQTDDYYTLSVYTGYDESLFTTSELHTPTLLEGITKANKTLTDWKFIIQDRD